MVIQSVIVLLSISIFVSILSETGSYSKDLFNQLQMAIDFLLVFVDCSAFLYKMCMHFKPYAVLYKHSKSYSNDR